MCAGLGGLQGAEAVRPSGAGSAAASVEDARVRGGANDVEHAAVGTVVDEERPVGTSGRPRGRTRPRGWPEVGAVDRTPGERVIRGVAASSTTVVARRPPGRGARRVPRPARSAGAPRPPPSRLVRPPQGEALIRRRQAASIPRADRKDVEVVEGGRPTAVEHVVGGERASQRSSTLSTVRFGRLTGACGRGRAGRRTQDGNDDRRRHERGAGDVRARRRRGVSNLVQRLWQLNKRGISHNEAAAPRCAAGSASI